MIAFSTPFALLLAIPLFALAILVWQRGYINLSPTRGWIALGIRLALITLIVLGLAGMSFSLPESREATVMVADLSASDSGARSSMQSVISTTAAIRPGADVLGVVSLGREPMVEQPPSPLAGFDGFQTSVNRDYTNLEGALEMAGAILPSGYRKRVVVLSDGQQNVGDALLVARLLHSEGVRVDVAPVRAPGGPEVLVDRVDVPSQLLPRETFALTVSLHSTVETAATIDIFRDRSLVGSRREIVHPGEDSYVFRQAPLVPGFHTYRVHVTPDIDTQSQNNSGSAYTTVLGPPRVLVISASSRQAASVMTSLRSTGIKPDLQSPAHVVPTLSYLQRYGAVVIVDTAADVLGPDLEAQLVPYVRDLGRGLVVIGGQEAYGMGGYGQTPLERVLPVNMDLPKRKDLPSAAVVLIIESLEGSEQINISKEAGKGVVDLLTQQDLVAINDAVDYGPGSGAFPVPLQHVTNKARIDGAIDQMQPGDPMSYAPFLRSAYHVLKGAHARVKHIILLGDGDAEDPGYEQLVKHIRSGGVTVSTVATNGMGFADFNTMQNIARWGGGRYYQANDVNAIPKIFLREARTVARSGIITGRFYPQELSANPMLRDLHGVPPLFGYVATTPKPTGEMVLVSKKLDPVLAGWQYGLGRSVAWTSDAAGLWTHDWLLAPGANRFWANLVSWTLPSSSGHHLFVSTSSSQGQGNIAVDIPTSLGADPNVVARVLDPGLHASSIQLQPSEPGRFSGAFQANGQGAYFVTVEAHGAGHAEAGQSGLDVPYSAEFRTSGTNRTFLQAVARAGGGSIVNRSNAVWQDNLPAAFAVRPLTPWLWLLAILLLPIDIGIRRLVISRHDLTAIFAALAFRNGSTRSEKPVVAPLNAVRARRSSGQAPVHQPGAATGDVFLASVPGLQRREGTKAEKPARAEKPPQAPESAASTASQLLAARRKRR